MQKAQIGGSLVQRVATSTHAVPGVGKRTLVDALGGARGGGPHRPGPTGAMSRVSSAVASASTESAGGEAAVAGGAADAAVTGGAAEVAGAGGDAAAAGADSEAASAGDEAASATLVQRQAAGPSAAGGAAPADAPKPGEGPGGATPAEPTKAEGANGLRVSEPGDSSEREADRVADELMRGDLHGLASGHGGSSPAAPPGPGAPGAPGGPGAPGPSTPRDLAGGAGELEQAPPEGSEEHTALLLGGIAQGGGVPGLPAPQPTPEVETVSDVPTIQPKAHPQGCVCCSHLQRSGGEPAGQASPAVEQHIAAMKGGGQSLPAHVREAFEARLGHDFSAVRIHTDERAQQATKALNAQAFAIGSDIAFAPGQYQPDTAAGQHLLAHELTHVVQQGAAPARGAGGAGADVSKGVQRHVQRGFFDSLWQGVKKIGSSIWSGLKTVGSAIWSGLKWLGNKLGTLIRDGFMWLVNLVRDLPERLGRLIITLAQGLAGIITFLPELIIQIVKHGFSGLGKWLGAKLVAGAAWVGTVVLRVLDLIGFPEIGELLLHLFSSVRKLTSEEKAAGKSVLGSGAIRWNDVRVGSGGVLDLIWKVNDGRPFTSWHTINAPPGTPLHTMVHELTHVYQYERVGTLYMAQALHAQATRGAGAYVYGDLVAHRTAGKKYSEFNREEQAQIADDYYSKVLHGRGTLSPDLVDAYKFYIAQLQAGQL